jgi:hypothetical protein
VESTKTSRSPPAKATNRDVNPVPPSAGIKQSEPKDKLLDYIHHLVEGKKASDAHGFLDNLIHTLNIENAEIEEFPQDDEILLVNPKKVPELRRTKQASPAREVGPETANMPATMKMEAPSVSSATAALGPMFANVVPAAPLVDLAFLHQLQQQATVTQTIYVTSSPTTITTTAPASSTDSSDSNGSQKGNRYMDEGGGRNSSVPVIAMLAVFGAILVIGPLIGYCWWRSRKRAEKNDTLPYFGRDMEARHGYPPVVGGYSSYHNNNPGVVSEHRALSQRNMGADAFAASSSRRPSTAPSVTRKQSKFKGKAHQLPPIDTSGLSSSDPPISPTFVPLPGTPMKLVPRQQVLSDPQRRRGVDALDLAAQRESNYKHWKAIKADDSVKSIMQPKSAEIPTGKHLWLHHVET